MKKAQAEYRAAADRAAAIDREIRSESEALASAIERFETERRSLESAIIDTEKRIAAGEARQGEILDTNAEKAKVLRGLTGSILSAARDLEALMKLSPLTALEPGRFERLEPYLDQTHVGDPADFFVLGKLYLDEISFSGRVCVHHATYIDRSGGERKGEIISLGKMTALYENPEETGFILFSPADHRMTAYSKRPSRGMEKRIRAYVSGKDTTAPVDLSFGRGLRRAAQQEKLTVRTRQGGAVLVALIVAVFAALSYPLLEKRLFRQSQGAPGDSPETSTYHPRWGLWSIRPQTFAHRLAIVTIFVIGLVVYVRGTTVIGQPDAGLDEVSLLSLVSLAPPPIAGRRVTRSMVPVTRLAEFVPSKNVTRSSAAKAEFEPELVIPTLDSPFAEGTPDVGIALDLTNLMSEDTDLGNDVVFEAYELDQAPQAVVKIPPSYPQQAREHGVEGAVQVRMLVRQDGSVGQVFIVDARPPGLFEESVKRSLQQWRFNPGKIDGKIVTAWVVTTIHFDLN